MHCLDVLSYTLKEQNDQTTQFLINTTPLLILAVVLCHLESTQLCRGLVMPDAVSFLFINCFPLVSSAGLVCGGRILSLVLKLQQGWKCKGAITWFMVAGIFKNQVW